MRKEWGGLDDLEVARRMIDLAVVRAVTASASLGPRAALTTAPHAGVCLA